MFRFFSMMLISLLAGVGALAQTSVGGTVDPFKNTQILKPPAGAKVAIIEWQDMECPVCARAFPIVHAAANQYKVPLLQYDYLISYHAWSRTAAIYARYMQDKISPDFAKEYRRQGFAAQTRIASQDELKAFTQRYLTTHGQQMPFALDPKFEKEVLADDALGKKLNIQATPTIFVVTPTHWIEVQDVAQLYSVLDQVKKDAGTAPAAATHHTPGH